MRAAARSICFAAAVTFIAAGGARAESDRVAATWDKAEVLITGSLVGSDRPFVKGPNYATATLGQHEVLNAQRDVPVVVAITGSGGDTPPLKTFFKSMMDLGLVVVIANSRARGADWIDCLRRDCNERQARKSLEFRVEEAEHAYRKLMAFPWASKTKTALLGLGWGGMTAALYPEDDFAARVILAWNCRTRNWSWLDGIRGSPETPVFAAIASRDPIYSGPPWVKGVCPVEGRPNSKSLLIDAGFHNVMAALAVKQGVHKFLWQTFFGDDGTRRYIASRHLLAPWVIEASPERITIKPGGSTQAVYALARQHCEKFGKKSALKSTTVDGGSYAFDCYVEED